MFDNNLVEKKLLGTVNKKKLRANNCLQIMWVNCMQYNMAEAHLMFVIMCNLLFRLTLE